MGTATDQPALLTRGLSVVGGTARAPNPYERFLLDPFVRGNLTLDRVLAPMESKQYEQVRRL
ncbi:hypothetical protein AUC43_09530 [Hymenobacter sedentarius]|uniref:Uncharacterized protein n=1 Tax=Hymenobacter sedentarius TaxID=1411621 RepID=A0A0U4C2M9_9BACT|nr:hypothetical protein [Hymenobacter sedentarius]ALW85314.1 hypothetical protein AUC43_09530 [Hymenobacter sedentarius]